MKYHYTKKQKYKQLKTNKMSKNWFKMGISYLAQLDNGSIAKKREEYYVDAVSHTEAEARLQGCLEEYIPEYNLLSCAKTNISDVVIDQAYTNFFKTKVSYISFDEDSGKEKKINENFLVQADSLKTTYDKIEIRLQGSIFEWEVKSIVKQKTVDIFPYLEDLVLSDEQ